MGVPSQSPHELDLDSRPPSRRDRSERNTPATKHARNQHLQERRQEQPEDEEDGTLMNGLASTSS